MEMLTLTFPRTGTLGLQRYSVLSEPSGAGVLCQTTFPLGLSVPLSAKYKVLLWIRNISFPPVDVSG